MRLLIRWYLVDVVMAGFAVGLLAGAGNVDAQGYREWALGYGIVGLFLFLLRDELRDRMRRPGKTVNCG